MATAELGPDIFVEAHYDKWFSDVRAALNGLEIEVDAWQDNWYYDFRKDYERGSTAVDAAMRAHDFWWEQLLAESWT